MIPIVPAVIPKSLDQIKTQLPHLIFSQEIHVDVVDGKFVPFISWPYEPNGVPKEISSLTDSFTLEVDLMVEDPITAAEAWIEAGADMLVFHVETINLKSFTEFVKTSPVSVGISSLNDTPLDTLFSYLNVADYVQLMGIEKIGVQGQSFDNRVFERIKIVKKSFPNHPIVIDGSVNKETILSLKQAGVNRLIVGSAIASAKNPYESYKELMSLIN